MSVKVSKYLTALILVVSILFLSIISLSTNVIAGNCYVYQTTCSMDLAPAGCTAGAISLGDCKIYADSITGGFCSEGDTAVCTLGCCCVGTQSYARMQGVCVSPNAFVPGDYSNCAQTCSGINTNVKHNLTGYVYQNNNLVSGATVYLDYNTGSSVFNITTPQGKYTFLNIGPTHSLRAEYGACSATQFINLQQTTAQINLTLDCPTITVSGFAVDTSGITISSNVNIYINDVLSNQISLNKASYSFTVPSQSKVRLVAVKSSDASCTGENSVTTGNTNTSLNVTVGCSRYNVNVAVNNQNGAITDAIVRANSQTPITSSGGTYSFSNVVGGSVMITATKTTTSADSNVNMDITCQNTSNVNIVGDNTNPFTVNLWLGQSTCCNTTTTRSQCQSNNQIQVTTTFLGTCAKQPIVTTESCSTGTPCPWICTDWTPSNCSNGETVQTRSCPTKNTSVANCDPNLATPQPEVVQSCNALCDNGVLDAGTSEECDYSVVTGDFNATPACLDKWTAFDGNITSSNFIGSINYIKTNGLISTICNFANCACLDPRSSPIQLNGCEDSGNITALNVNPVPMVRAFNLDWSMSSDLCSNYVDHFVLKTCSGNNCALESTYNILNNNISKDTVNYTHLNPSMTEKNKYCYELIVVFNNSIPLENRTANITTCVASGDEVCLGTHDASWCQSNKNATCNATNNVVTSDCPTAAPTCYTKNGNAACMIQGNCDLCNGFWGLFSYQGLRLPITGGVSDGKTLVCPSLSDPVPPKKTAASDAEVYGCYMDFSKTTIDKAYSCSDTNLCYDYYSESSCTQDYCSKFTSSNGTNKCEWINFTSDGSSNIFMKGICRPKNESEQECGLCNNPSNRLFSTCTPDTCKMYGSCYLKQNLETGIECVAKKDIMCTDYGSKDECIGTNGSNITTDVTWSPQSATIADLYKSGGTNRRIYNSSDGAGLGICRYIDGIGCIRDADNNYPTEIISSNYYIGKDCMIFNSALKNICERDTIAPITTITNKPKYGLLMNLKDQVVVKDNTIDNNIWPLGDAIINDNPTDRTYIWLYYCIALGTNTCYPTSVLNVSTDDAFIINLTQYGINPGDVSPTVNIFYFAEDPAKNLEYPIKNFTFQVDTIRPNVSVVRTTSSYPINDIQMLTDLAFTLNMLIADDSPPVTCSFKIVPETSEASQYFKNNYKNQYDIVSNVISTATPLTTTYLGLIDGKYHSELDCFDSVGNEQFVTENFTIAGDMRINSASPSGNIFTTKDAYNTGSSFDVPISIQTNSSGVCKYTLNQSYALDYNNMESSFSNSADGLTHTNTVSIPIRNATGIYKYYVACNLTINGKSYIVPGTGLSDPYFSIDDSPPITNLEYRDNSAGADAAWSEYNSSINASQRLQFRFICDDSNPLLTLPDSGINMSKGCNNTYYCIETSSNNYCNDIATYSLIGPNGIISFDYGIPFSPNKTMYGNNPVLHYYSIDNGNNRADPTIMRLDLQNTQLNSPEVKLIFGQSPTSILLNDSGSVGPIDESYITVNVNYLQESNVTITNIQLKYVSSGTNIAFDSNSTLSGAEYSFVKGYIENGDYQLIIDGTDDDDNSVHFESTFTITHADNNVTLVSPKVGIGSTPNYTITLSSIYYSTCKYSMYALEACPSISMNSCRWNDPLYIDVTNTGTSLHSFVHDGSTGMMYIVCQTLSTIDPTDESSFVSTSFHVGYNTTVPQVNITYIQTPPTKLDDNRIINASSNKITIQIFTDQPSVCTINSTNTRALLNINPSVAFDGEDAASYDQYYMVHNYTLDYNGKGVSEGVFNYTINCTALSQLSTIKNINISLMPNTPPPIMALHLQDYSLTLKSYNVTCDGLCMDTYQTTYQYALVNQSMSCSNLQPSDYTTQNYSEIINVNDTYMTSRICVIGTDILGRTNMTSTDVSMIRFNNGEMNITYPYIYYDGDGIQNQVYSSDKIIELNITTIPNATCKIIHSTLINTDIYDTPAKIYAMDNSLPGQGYKFNITSEGADILTNAHSTKFQIMSIENVKDPWAVVCLVQDATTEDLYISRELFLYWDNTTPVYTSNSAVPPKIYDWSNSGQVLLNIATDDETQCILDLSKSTINARNNGVALPVEYLNYNGENIVMLNSSDPALFNSFNQNKNYTRALPVKWLDNLNLVANYSFNVSCWNRAYEISWGNISMYYALEKSVIINLTSGNIFNGTTWPINLTTNIISTCSATVDGVSRGQLSTLDGINHATVVDVTTSGNHTLMIYCNVIGNSNIAPNQTIFNIISDDALPEIDNLTSVSGKTYTCGLDGIKIRADMSDDAGIAGYSYTITGPDLSPTLMSKNASYISKEYSDIIIYNGTLVDGEIYDVDVQAVDIASKQSEAKRISITARNRTSSVLCDNVLPTLNITTQSTEFLDKIEATVSCSDDTGCKPIYFYSFTNNTTCADETYSNSESYENNLTFSDDGLLCVKGEDLAGNTGYSQYNITLGIDTSNPLNITPVPTSSELYIYPNFIVTNVSVINLTVSTSVDALCRYASNPILNETNLSKIYSQYIELDVTGNKTHTKLNFDTKGIYSQDIDIICNSSSLTNNVYSKKTITIIYTTDTPTVTAYAIPSTIIDWNNRESILTINTIPDTACTVVSINNTDTENTPLIIGNYSNGLTYKKLHVQQLTYTDYNQQQRNFTYRVWCKSLGNLNNNPPAELNVSYDISNDLSIDLLSPSIYGTRTVGLLIQTNLISSCSLKWDGTDEGEMMANVTGLQHYLEIETTYDGNYTAEFACITPITGVYYAKNITITVDSSILTGPAPYCGDGNITGTEVCNNQSLNGMTCTHGWVSASYVGGVLKCKSDCSGYDFSTCDDGHGWCGNGKVDGPNTLGMYEMCDGSVPSGLSCVDFGFQGGSLSCNNCNINTSGCRQTSNGLLGTGSYTCGNNIFESGEQCEDGTNSSLTCADFGYSGGSLSCSVSTNCQYVMSSCYFDVTNPSHSYCGNNIKEGGEQCDNTSGLSTVSCETLGNYTGGTVSCTHDCKYNLTQCTTNANACTNNVKDSSEADVDCGGSCTPCGLNKNCFDNSDCASKICILNKCAADPCTNGVFDNGSETDIDCGKTCSPCALDKNCDTNADCTSDFCKDGVCSVDTCSNGVKDEGESDIDCGGTCTLCDVGKACNTNGDCSNDNCVDNVCSEPGPATNPIKIPLLIIGIVLILGGGGYIIYKSFIEKKSTNNNFSNYKSQMGGLETSPQMMPVRPVKLTPEQEKIVEKQHEAMLKKRQDRADERKGVLNKLEESLTSEKGKSPEDKDSKFKDSNKIDWKKSNKDSSSSPDDDEFVDITKIKSKKNSVETKDTFSKLKDIGKNEDKAFDKLQKINVDTVSKKISQISGTPQDDIKPTLNRTSELGYSDAIKLFGDIDRETIMSGVFKEVLSQLLDSGKITKEHVSNILFEYMDKGMITKSDVAKISSELKII